MKTHDNFDLPETNKNEAPISWADELTRPTDRREAIKKVGKLAAYTGPAMLILVSGQKAAFGY